MIVLDENVVSGKGMLLSDRGDCAQDASMIVNVDLFGECAGETYFVLDENTSYAFSASSGIVTSTSLTVSGTRRESVRLLADGLWFDKRLDPNSLS